MKIIPKALIIVLMTSAPVSKLLSQDFKHWEVGTDLLWLINKNEAYPSFFAKKLFLKKKKNISLGSQLQGYRFRVGFNYDNPNQTAPANAISRFNQVRTETLVRIGYEWHKSISSFDIFYGFDGYFEFMSFTYDANSINVATNQSTYSLVKSSDVKAGISPVVGAKCKITSSIYASIESDFQILYHGTNITATQFIPYYNKFVIGEGDGIIITAHPIYTINLVFILR